MTGEAMTRFGIYKRVWRLVGDLDGQHPVSKPARRITPHVFRHTTAVHVLEAGVEVDVIRDCLGHVSLETTNRYAETTLRMEQDASTLCEPTMSKAPKRKPVWHDDAELMKWVASLQLSLGRPRTPVDGSLRGIAKQPLRKHL